MNSKFGPGSIVYSSSQNIINRSTTSLSEKRMTTATTTIRNKEIQIRRPRFPMFAFNDDDNNNNDDHDNRHDADNHHKILLSTPLLSSSSSSEEKVEVAVTNNINDNGSAEELSVTDVLDLASTLTDSTQPTLE